LKFTSLGLDLQTGLLPVKTAQTCTVWDYLVCETGG